VTAGKAESAVAIIRDQPVAGVLRRIGAKRPWLAVADILIAGRKRYEGFALGPLAESAAALAANAVLEIQDISAIFAGEEFHVSYFFVGLILCRLIHHASRNRAAEAARFERESFG
jgi:hypothetical protein